MRSNVIASVALGIALLGGAAYCATTVAHKTFYLYTNMAESKVHSGHSYQTAWIIAGDQAAALRQATAQREKYFPASKGFVDQRTLLIRISRGVLQNAISGTS